MNAISSSPQGGASFFTEHRSPTTLVISFKGNWRTDTARPAVSELLKKLGETPSVQEVVFKADEVSEWDATLPSLLFEITKNCDQKGIKINKSELPKGIEGLLALALAVPERKGARRVELQQGNLEKIGRATVSWKFAAQKSLYFIGEASSSFLRLLTGRARLPRGQVGAIMESTGPQALPIVTLISVLVGLILAFIGAIQLRQFGAQIYVANLVGIAMAREMGAIMAGIIMAGRTGAAFAAQLGTMQVNEEIDALDTLGVSPMEFLVLPRLVALIIMMPLLCLYADLMGVLGGLIVSVGTLDVSVTQYLNQTQSAITLSDIWIGVIKSIVFGILVAFTGCMQGMNCGRSATAVGECVTSAVVIGIISIVVTDAVFAILTNILGI